MARLAFFFVRTPLAAAAALLSASPPAFAQGTTTTLAPVSVTGRAIPAAGVAGWGDLPAERLPASVTLLPEERLRDVGAQRLADLVGLDPAVTDAYNPVGYWDMLAVRGFTLDNRFNFRRDGLPINAETSIPLDNKSRVEILKGASGMQAGTSAPGGLVNLVVKRPTDAPLRSASVEWRERGNVTGRFDFSDRSGSDGALGIRINGAAEHLAPQLREARGSRVLLAFAAEARVAPGALLEAEFESSHRSQPSQPGFSLLGRAVPAPGDPRINLNNQPWSLPVVLDGDTASLRWRQRLGADWRFTAHAMTQRLHSDDRVAFPFGCTGADGSWDGHAFCADGSFDLYDYRSDNERRRSDAVELVLDGRIGTGAVVHAVSAGVLVNERRERFERLAFNWVGIGNVDASAFWPAAPALTGENTNRDSRSTEFHLRDAIALGPQWTTWLGLRHTRLARRSALTDGSEATSYHQSLTTPFAALSWAFAPGHLAYASVGRGVESEVVPNRTALYRNAGQALPALTSRQVEVGLRANQQRFDWNVAAFDIARPLALDAPACDPGATVFTRVTDGRQRHRGVEAGASVRAERFTLGAGALWLRPRVEDSSQACRNGLVPPNVPARTLRVDAQWRPSAALTLHANLVHEGGRFVLPDNSVRIPGWTRVDAALEFVHGALTWRAGIDNLLDRRAWREAPYQFDHTWLYPLAPRTLRLAIQLDL